MATVSAALLKSCFDACVERGCPPEPLLGAAGADASAIHNAEGRYPVAAFMEMMHLAHRLTGDATLSLRAGMTFRPSSTLTMALVSCSTLREAMGLYDRFQRVVQEFGKSHFEVDGSYARIDWRSYTGDPVQSRPAVESSFAAHATFGRRLTWLNDLPMRKVRFRHPGSGQEDYARQLFQCEVMFEQQADELIFDASLLDLKLPQSNPALLAVLTERLGDELLALHAPETTRGAVYRCLQRLIEDGAPSARQAASALGVSERTLRRRLAAEQATYRDILEEVRRDMCRLYLKDPTRSMADISAALGFSEQSAFSRAFKSWYGVSPSKYARRP